MEAQFSLSTERILSEIYALTALRHLDPAERPWLLSRANEPALRRVLIGCFGDLVLGLLPLVTDTNVADVTEDSPHLVMTLRLPDDAPEPMPPLIRGLAERALARMVFAFVYSDTDTAAAQGARLLSDQLRLEIRRTLCADDCDVRLTGYF